MSTNNIKGQEVGKEEENLKQTKAEKDELSVSTNKKVSKSIMLKSQRLQM